MREAATLLAEAPPAGHEEDYRALYDTAPCGYLTMRRDGTVVSANQTLRRWIGRHASRGAPRLRDLLSPASWVVFSMKCATALAMQGEIREVALDLLRPGGRVLPVLASFQRLEQDADALIRGTLFDATERRCYERDLLAARKRAEVASARLSSVLEATTDGVLLAGADWLLTYANPRALALLPSARIGTDLRDAFADADGRFRRAFAAAMAGETPDAVEGAAGAAWLSARAYPAPDGGTAVFVRDTTAERRIEEERRRAAARMEHLATHDGLTGLANRALLRTRLREALEGGGAAALCLDLDRFKQVNDRLGHAAGDALLKAVAGRLRAELRAGDTVARLGGDEFAVVLAAGGPAGLEARAEAVAARLVRAIAAPYALGGEWAEVGTSVGIAVAADTSADPDALLDEADTALYHAKRSGRGRHAVFRPELVAEQRARVELADALRQALQHGELLLHHQPIVDVGTRRIRGHEALVRWNRPGHGLVSPGVFIPVAEETGLIEPLGEWVLGRACADAAAWPDRSWRVSVNLSPLQLRDETLADKVEAALRDSGLDASRLELEITETAVLDGTPAVAATIGRLCALGVALAMDDFGTGHSSLASLRSFPFGRVKIDRRFVTGATSSDADAAVVEAVAGLALRLGMACTAEGIETEEQLALVARAGYCEGQGFLLGRPAPQEDLLRSRA